MLKKTLTYKTVDGDLVTEDFYFNLTKAELAMLAMSGDGEDLAHRVKAMIQLQDGRGIVNEFVKILQMSYGKKSEDGKRFIKDPEIWKEFTQTEAYSDLVMEVLTDPEKSAAFINGLIPQDMQARVEEQMKAAGETGIVVRKPKQLKDYTQAELRELSREEFQALLDSTASSHWTKDALVVAMDWTSKS